jgi:hypothetical protein
MNTDRRARTFAAPKGAPAAKRRAEVFAQRWQASASGGSNLSLSPVPRLPAGVGQKTAAKVRAIPRPLSSHKKGFVKFVASF